MKGLFPQYDNANVVNFSETWKTALFVFDTNILLNLYRYQSNTCEELITVIKELSERIWIPHHVALEFQRNRLSVIAAQGRKFSDIRNILTKAKTGLFTEISKLSLQKRHALIDTESLLSEFDELVKKFLDQLDQQQHSQQRPTEKDPLKYRIEELFHEKVGIPFADQNKIDTLSKTAENRYKFKIPPGYEDSGKDKDGPDEFSHSGLIYKRKYGDYFTWTQILDYAKKTNRKSVIFITDDGKEDWWSLVEFNGVKTIGARPELIEEAAMLGGIESFLMYKPEGFLQYAKEFLKAKVSEETLSEVRDVSKNNKQNPTQLPPSTFLLSETAIEHIICNWIVTQGYTPIYNERIPVDYLYESEIGNHGFQLKRFQLSDNSKTLAISAIYYAYTVAKAFDLDAITVIFTVKNESEANILIDILRTDIVKNSKDNLYIVAGVISEESPSAQFEPLLDFRYNDLKPASYA
ncbi:PIN domain-containing protein [Pseudomonas sp. GT1P32]